MVNKAVQNILDNYEQIYNSQLQILNNASNNVSLHLSDKNRLIANANANIQKSFSRLNEVNDKINTITQDIYINQIELERKEIIVKTMKSIILIMVILFVVMLVYYGSGIVEQKFPEAYNSIKNNFTNFGNFGKIK